MMERHIMQGTRILPVAGRMRRGRKVEDHSASYLIQKKMQKLLICSSAVTSIFSRDG
jgi:hypothetical protein